MAATRWRRSGHEGVVRYGGAWVHGALWNREAEEEGGPTECGALDWYKLMVAILLNIIKRPDSVILDLASDCLVKVDVTV